MNEEKELEDCVICFETLTIEKTINLPCKHSFHLDCIKKWVKESATCPMCRKKISSIFIENETPPEVANSIYDLLSEDIIFEDRERYHHMTPVMSYMISNMGVLFGKIFGSATIEQTVENAVNSEIGQELVNRISEKIFS